MALHLQREIDKLKKQILSLGAQVEDNLWRSVQSLVNRDERLAREAVDKDAAIDAREVEVEEECLKILALHQPVAIDLRFIISVLKIDHDLERIGDHAMNIAERALLLSGSEPVEMPADALTRMAKQTQEMLREVLDSLVNLDPKLAREVWAKDDAVDELNNQVQEQLLAAMRADPDHVKDFLYLVSCSRGLERIADHATNIAKDVIYMVEGNIVRHRHSEFV